VSIESLDLLNEDKFFSKLVPAFEEIKSELHAILGKSRRWSNLISKLYLVYINNKGFEAERQASFLYISKKVTRHLYLTNSTPDQEHFSHIGQFLDENIYYAFRPLLRTIFIEEILNCSTLKQLAEYIYRLLAYSFQNVEKIETSKYIRLRFISVNTSEPLLALYRYKENIIIPKQATLDASETVGSIGIDHRTGIDKLILITNRRNVDGYKSFDSIFDFRHLRNYLCSNFTSATGFYKQVLRLNYEEIFDICYLIGVSLESDIFWLKREIVYLPYSEGKVFETCMKRFLQICFKPHYQMFVINDQVPNKGRLRIRDFVIVNNKSTSSFLQGLKKKNVDFLLFDAKNYADELTPRDIDTFREYLAENPAFGNVGIILSRKGASDHCHESIFRSLIERQMKIIVLDQNDLLSMLDDVTLNSPSLNTLENRYNDLLMER